MGSLLLVAVLVLGVVGMHALSTSCGEGTDHATMAMTSTTSPDDGTEATPSHNDADVTFAQQMIPHRAS